MNRRRACDRCYAIKEKCEFRDGSASCSRCLRLGHLCATKRVLRAIGRRPKQPKKQETRAAEPSANLVTTTPNEFDGLRLRAHEKSLISYLLEKSNFIDHLVVGPSFADGVQRSIRARFLRHPELLKDMFLACANGVSRARGHALETEEMSLKQCARAVKKFRGLTVREPTDAMVLLGLGTGIMTFDLVTSAQGASMICRYTLSCVKPFVDILAQDSEFNFELYCLVFIDTTDCLMHCELPVIRLEVRDPTVVDRYVGLCSTLLSIFYDICVVGRAARLREAFETEAVEDALLRWKPTPPANIDTKYTTSEVMLMLTHAKVHQEAAMLILHRVKFPYGREAGVALTIAQSIFHELEVCFSVTGKFPFQITLALLVAGLELSDKEARQKLIRDIPNVQWRFPSPGIQVLIDFIQRIWSRIDAGDMFYWYELGDVPSFLVAIK